MEKRKTLTKKQRVEVYNKYNGHCSYCGNEIEYKNMQVDHIVPIGFNGIDNIENYNPSCRLCNHYKRANSLNLYRLLLKTLHERLRDIYIFKVAEKYGIVTINKWDGKFYFEKQEESR